MIIDLFLKATVGVLTAVIGLIPTWSLPMPPEMPVNCGNQGLGCGMGPVVGTLVWMDALVPVRTIFAVIGATIALAIALGLWNLLMFIYDKVPGKAS